MVNVIGLGYIGLPTALMLASHGVEVIGTDYNSELVATLNANKTTNYPCLCLCLGFSQITMIFPFLLMILHFSQIGFTDDLTFMIKPPFKK